MSSNNSRADFGSKIGMILATAGSAVGLGNIWRFPTEAGKGGGGAFLIVYIACILLVGLPLMTAEFVVGRAAHTNTAQAYKRLGGGWLWRHVGQFGVFIGWFILCYYIVVSGWTLNYLVTSLRLGPYGAANWDTYFGEMVARPWEPIVYMAVFMLMSHFVIVRGVQKGIEKFSKILMPLLFLIMVVLCVCSLFTPRAAEGLDFLFTPDFSQLHFKTVLGAMGQAFYSLSIGMGCLCTYASYFSKETRLVKTAFQISAIDTLVAVMAGIIIFPACFSAGIEPDAGPSLVFIALPKVFHDVFGAWPILAWVVSVLFYALLVLATLTSAISLQEVPTAYLAEDCGLSRGAATSVVSGVCIALGAVCSLSMGPLSDWTLFGKNIFDLFDFVSSNIFLPLSGACITFFVGWRLERSLLMDELTNGGAVSPTLARCLVGLLKYFVPFAIVLVFLSGIGIF